MLKSSFPKYQGGEFKFSSIWNSGNKARLPAYAKAVAKLPYCPFAYYIDKKFAVLAKTVDLLVEPYMRDAGYDFYSDGFNWKYSNYIHFGLTEIGDATVYDAVIDHYLRFSRKPSKETLALLQFQFRLMANSLEEPVQLFLEQMSLGADLFEKYHEFDEFKKTNDLQMTTTLAVIGHWRQQFREDLALVHDDSSNFLRSKEAWAFITRMEAEKQSFIAGDGTVVEFPLRLVSTKSVDSKNSFAVQFCDLLAGLVTRLFDPRLEGENLTFMNDVVAAGLNTVTSNGIRASTTFPDQIPPKRLDGPDIIDQMSVIMFPNNT